MKNQIEVNDVVDVRFHLGFSLLRLKVLHAPAATGECWRMMTERGTIVYIQQFESMVLLPKKPDPPAGRLITEGKLT